MGRIGFDLKEFQIYPFAYTIIDVCQMTLLKLDCVARRKGPIKRIMALDHYYTITCSFFIT